MILDLHQCQDLLTQFQFELDERKPPDNLRRGQFKAGWTDATIRGATYNDNTLKGLTWHNLGYRLGKTCGARDESEIEETYECFASHYKARGPVVK